MLVSGNDFYCGNSSLNPSQLALKSMIPDVSGFATSTDLNSLKTSVSSGKSLVASAVTGKGVSTAADASFQIIANNINAIPSALSTSLTITKRNGSLNVGDNDMTQHERYAISMFCEGRSAGKMVSIYVDRTNRTGFVAHVYLDYNNDTANGWFGPINLYGGSYPLWSTSIAITNGGDVVNIAGNDRYDCNLYVN